MSLHSQVESRSLSPPHLCSKNDLPRITTASFSSNQSHSFCESMMMKRREECCSLRAWIPHFWTVSDSRAVRFSLLPRAGFFAVDCRYRSVFVLMSLTFLPWQQSCYNCLCSIFPMMDADLVFVLLWHRCFDRHACETYSQAQSVHSSHLD
jgi:hypothetical protein